MMASMLAVLMVCVGAELTVGEPALVGEDYVFTEGPLWTGEGGWVFSDVREALVYRLDGTVLRTESGGANGMALDAEGRIVFAEGASGRITRLESDGTYTVLADSFEGGRFVSPNDLTIHSNGTIYFTDPRPLRSDTPLARDSSGLFAVHPDGRVQLLAKDLPYPNGVGLSPDEKTLYVAMTIGREIRAYDVTEDGVANERHFADATISDGLAVDAEGRVWCAVSGGVAVYTPDGTFIERIATRPTPTNCGFGGEDGSVLLITARQKVYRLQTTTRGAR